MKKIILNSLIIGSVLLTYSNSNAQSIYKTGFDNTAEKAGWQLFRKGASSGPYWVYATSGAFSAPEYLTHYYPVGGTLLTDDWFVSPMLHFPSGAVIDSIRNHFSGPGKPNPGADTVAIYLLTGNADPAMADEKILLYDYRDATYNNDGDWHITKNINIPPSATHCYLAFRYCTVSNWLVVGFDNLSISNTTTGIMDPETSAGLKLFPNPVKEMLHLDVAQTNGAEIMLCDLSGKILLRRTFSPELDLSHLPSGSYIVQVRQASGIILKTQIIKK